MTEEPFRITTGLGWAEPLDRINDFLPESLDDAVGATEAREAYEAHKTVASLLPDKRRTASAAYIEEHGAIPMGGARDSYVHDLEHALRPLDAEIRSSERESRRLLLAYWHAQRAAGGRTTILAAWLAEDARARTAFSELEAALAAREELYRWTGVRPEHSARPGRGHYAKIPNGPGMDSGPTRDALRAVVTVVPRVLIAEALAKLEAKKAGR